MSASARPVSCAGVGVLEPQDRGVPAGALDGVEEQHVVVLRRHPAGVGQHGEQVGPDVVGRRERCCRVGPTLGQVGRLRTGPVVQGGLVLERLGRHVRQDVAALLGQDPQAAGVGDLADDRRADLPRRAISRTSSRSLGLHDRQHALLGLRGHDLERLHAGLALGHPLDEHVHAGATLGRGLRRGTGDARAPQVLDTRRRGSRPSSSRQASISRFSSNGSPTCTLGRFWRVRLVVGEPGGGQHRDAADAVTTGGRPEQHRQVAHTLGAAEHQTIGRHQRRGTTR